MVNNQNILKLVKKDKHTDYMACAQYVDWIPSGFADEIHNAFILQEICLEKEIDGETTAVHYYEVWHVSDGICEKEPSQVSDDLFCIGHTLDDSDALKESIGHRGKVTFTPRVFLVKEEDPLYSDIQSWPTDVVKEANGLHACYYTEEMEQKVKGYQEYHRESFCHVWDFDDPNKIYNVILNYCKKMFHKDNKIDRTNFDKTINDFFPEGLLPGIKQRIIDSWNNQ